MMAHNNTDSNPTEQTAVTQNTEDLKGKSVATPETALARAQELIAAGKKFSATGQLEQAAETLAHASGIYADFYGQDAVECADVLFLYGSALFANAVSKCSPLGGSMAPADAEAALPAKESSRFVFSGDGDENGETEDSGSASAPAETVDESAALDAAVTAAVGAAVAVGVATAEALAAKENEDEQEEQDQNAEEEDGDEEEGEADPVEEDMQLAWEILDLARLGYRKLGPDGEMQMADVLLVLGDVSLEQGQWDQAVEDFTEAVAIKAQRLAADDREHAEANYKLGLAYEFAKNFDKAIESQTKVISVLETKLNSLKKLTGAELTEAVQTEVDDIEGLISDIQSKIMDINLQIEESKKAAAAAEPLAPAASSSSSAVPAVVNDISSLVKPKKASSSTVSPAKPVTADSNVPAVTTGTKRKAEETDDSSDAAKKAKEEN